MSNAKRDAAVQRLLTLVTQSGVRQVRLAWCDLHGLMRGKTVLPAALPAALRQGVGMVGTIVLKDTSDRTAWKVFDEGGVADLPGFEAAANLLLLPDPDSFRMLPWAEGTGWLRCDLLYPDGRPVPLDPRHQLQRALQSLAQHPSGPGGGLKLVCGLEVEFHIYRIRGDVKQPDADPVQAAWPGPAPMVELLHPGYQLLGEAATDRCDEALSIVRDTALGLACPSRRLRLNSARARWKRCSGPPTLWWPLTTWPCSAAVSSKHWPARGTTPPSCAARLLRRSCPVAGICTSR
jgi:glutamine synthetase